MKLQIALEFIIIFAFLLVVFIFMFALIATQRANVARQQSFSEVQLLAQNIAQQIDLGISAGNGYASNLSLYSSVSVPIYSVNITQGGIVIVSSKVNTQVISAVAYTDANNIIEPSYLSNNTLSIQNSFGQICIDEPCYNILNTPTKLYLQAMPYIKNKNSGYLIFVNAKNYTGYGTVNSLIGLSSTLGNFSKYSFSSNITNMYGSANAFISRSSSSGQSIIKATAYSGSSGMISNLSAWFPLNLGSGNNVYDLSGYNAMGTITNAQWSMPNYVSSFSGSGYLSIQALQIPSQFSLSVWVSPSSYATTGILGQQGSSAGVFSLSTTTAPASYSIGINGFGSIQFGSYTPNTWSLITLTYNAPSENLSVYENGQLILSKTEPQSLGSNLPLLIGSNNINSGGFNGKLSNLQLYSTYLSPSEVSELYGEGIASTPINVAQLLAWLPLNGNLNNYVSSSYSTYATGSIQFSNPNITSTNPNDTSFLAGSFDGSNSIITLSKPSNAMLQGGYTYPLSINVWFILNNAQATQPILSTLPSSSCGYYLSIDTENTISLSDNCGDSYSQTIPLTTKKWYDLAITTSKPNSNGISVITYYINGIYIGSTSIPWKDDATWTTLAMGSTQSSYFDGNLSNIQIYNTTLSNSSILSIYQHGETTIPFIKNLTAWFPLEGSPSDLTINNNSYTSSNILFSQFYSRPYPISYALNGYGLSFSGNNYVSGTSNTIVGSNTFSISGWIYPLSTNNLIELLNSYTTSSSSLYLALNNLVPTSNVLELNLSVVNGGIRYSALGGYIKPYTWYFVSGTYNGVALTTYINGEQQATTPYTATIPNAISSFTIGAYANGVSGFSGDIADLSLYKTALNQSQLSFLYKLGLPASSSIGVSLR